MATTFKPSASFQAKIAEMNAKTARTDSMLDQAVAELKQVTRDTLDKLSRIEKLNIVKRVAQQDSGFISTRNINPV